MRLRDRLWLALTGQPWFTEHRASDEFGPPIAARVDTAGLSDAELMRMPAPTELQAARVASGGERRARH